MEVSIFDEVQFLTSMLNILRTRVEIVNIEIVLDNDVKTTATPGHPNIRFVYTILFSSIWLFS